MFDEIDAGISGEVVLRIGEVMDSLADHMPVLVISHLPQIASKGKAHFKVYKVINSPVIAIGTPSACGG
ncbi:MAG: hypothetical protein LBE37_19585 [Sphingobacterium sp.]|jgi:DNA repair protein RecN (Recombination protein N)|nr:hypothetical protein [Sphingobacterium sp.]